ncbi:MAG: hypothetical protein JWP00_3706 [Chloroflexi bacterium]|jgi:hypothetical protein|nr:hypothetical protein [Chloroflexota bacterium]
MAANPQNNSRRVITSFMLRFVREADDTPVTLIVPPTPDEPVDPELASRNGAAWRGVVKHIQSGAEQHFSTMAEAENFMKKYIED